MKKIPRANYHLTYLILFICLASLLLLAGCSSDFFPFLQEEKEEPQIVIPEEHSNDDLKDKRELPEGVLYLHAYFVEEKGNRLVPVTFSIPWTQGVARAALEKLIAGPTPAQEMRYGLKSPLPPTTKILGLTIRDGLARLDLSSSFLSYNPDDERLVLNSVVFTLLQFPTVRDVQILVEGSPPEVFPGGTSGKGTFSWERGLNLEVAEEVTDFEHTQPVTLYFCTVLGENNIFYLPVTRIIPADKDIFQATLDELLKGPRPGNNIFTELPQGTQVRNYTLEEYTLIVDFSRDILNYKGGLSGEKNIVKQVVLTLTEIPGVEKVQMLVEGDKITMTYGTSLEEPIVRPAIINPLQ